MLSCEHDRPPVLSLGLIGHRDTLHDRCSCKCNSGTRCYQRLIMILATPARGCQVLADCSIAIRTDASGRAACSRPLPIYVCTRDSGEASAIRAPMKHDKCFIHHCIPSAPSVDLMRSCVPSSSIAATDLRSGEARAHASAELQHDTRYSTSCPLHTGCSRRRQRT